MEFNESTRLADIIAAYPWLPEEAARQFADPALLQRDEALAALQNPDERADGEVFSALCFFDGKRLSQSPVLRQGKEQGERLFSQVWREALRQSGEKELFIRCFGEAVESPWHPFANAVYCWEKKPGDVEYQLGPCRSFRCQNGVWRTRAYEKLSMDQRLFHGLLRQADLMLRRHLKTGGYLKEHPEDAWAAPIVRAVIAAEERAAAEAARPKLVLDLGGLDQIRRDALITRNSLLTEEEREEAELAEAPTAGQSPAAAQAPAPEAPAGLPLDGVQLEILRALLDGSPAESILRAHRLMPAMTADMINEALFDEFGDSVIDCENDTLSLVEDYREDLIRLLGGNHS